MPKKTMPEPERDITEDEAALYDRQIRVWGVHAQTMLRNSRVLVIGMSALNLEVCKNLVLSGIGSLTIWDDSTLSEDEDISSHFLLNSKDIGMNKAEAAVPRISELNPNVTVEAITSNTTSQSSDFWSMFRVVCVSGQSLSWMRTLESQLGSLKEPPAVFLCETISFDGFFCQNLFQHRFVVTIPGESGVPDEHKDDEISFPKISGIFSAPFAQIFAAFGRRCKKEAAIFAAIRLMYAFHDKFCRWPDESDSAAIVDLQRETENVTAEGLPLAKDVMDIVKHWRVESAAAAAVLGGILSQEILKTITRKDPPLLNVTLFHGWGNSAVNVQIPARC